MNADEFVSRWHREKDSLLSEFTNPSSGAAAAVLIAGLGLSSEQAAGVARAMDMAISDTMYTLLLGLDGAAGIGGVQESFRIRTEQGASVAEPGELEAAAWRHFHGH
ncbi:MAG: hypothetical protein ACK501_05890 [Planctomycetota bacterium]|jgi:hypothetical protein